MCLIIIAHRMSPDYPLVLAANRDEFFARPTRQAHDWAHECAHESGQESDGASIIAGRDLQAGGTWLAVGRDGRFAAVTNVREAGGNGAGRRSRGELPVDFLASPLSPAEYLAQRSGGFADYAGFNLLLGDVDSVCYASNRAPGTYSVGAEIIGLANGAPGSNWPKVARGREKMARLLAGDARVEKAPLLAMMRDERQAGQAWLPETGLPDEQERRLSPMFIPAQAGGYGTRCISVFIRDGDGRCHFTEQNFALDGQASGRHDFDFSIRQPPVSDGKRPATDRSHAPPRI